MVAHRGLPLAPQTGRLQTGLERPRTVVQPLPFSRAISGWPALAPKDPTAQQSLSLTQVTPFNPPGLGLGVLAMAQLRV